MKLDKRAVLAKLWRYLNPLLFVAVFLMLTGGSIRYFFFWYAPAPLPVANSITDNSLGIKIVGQRDFVVQVKRALWLMKDKHPFSFVTTKKYVGVIQESASTWMTVGESPPVCLLSRKDAFSSLTWCAAMIAHETYHSKLYNDYRTQKGLPVPRWINGGPAAEHQCLRYQLSVGEFIGAPKSEINFLRRGDVSYSMQRGDVSSIFITPEGE